MTMANGCAEVALADTQPEGPVTFKKVLYSELNSRQQENFNFQKVSAHLADYGYNCLRLSDDWQGADFIACHIDGNRFLKVQLKGRLTIQKKYIGKDIYVAFNHKGTWYVYPHDRVMKQLLQSGTAGTSTSWLNDGGYSWPSLSVAILKILEPYKI